ncbi:ABC transporter permease subunit [Corynebacterium gerontici]|uniref:ABC-2 family transporter protein n=1 Tax=Corynebacterium gerontici TaxID=2079234 RepID=A0A3G6IXT7_9CORY|nr:ABC transporter permease subunit [Corynebacterium gerontici]AZA10595.1 ABC-2 family transporter protein [Corynebacterium gerontici]
MALLAVLTLYSSFYPSMGMDVGMEQFIQAMPKGMVDALGFAAITSGAGWVHSTFFSLLGLFVLCGAGVVWGKGAIAGQEETGVLELTLAHGISRSSVYWQKVAAIVVRFVLLGFLVALGLAVLNGPAKLGRDWGKVLAEILSYLLIGFLCSCVALAIGTGTGKAGPAVGGGAAVIVLGFILDALGKANADLEHLRNF